MIKISIIIPLYNSERYLDRLLKSLFEQTYKNYEIIFVNDGSTDNSLKIINEYQKQDKKIKCISIKNSGPGIARKRGFEISTGELLFFIDSDDYIPNDNAFEEIIRIYEREHFDILFFDVIQKLKKREKRVSAFANHKKLKPGKINIEYLYNNNVSPALWYKIFVRKKMKEEYFCNYNNFEDFYTTYKYLNDYDNFYYINEIFYYTDRTNTHSLSKKNDKEKTLKTIELLKKIYNGTKYKNAVKRTICQYYITTRRTYDKLKLTRQEKKECIKESKQLKNLFTIKDLIKFKLSIKDYLKYIYYFIEDITM